MQDHEMEHNGDSDSENSSHRPMSEESSTASSDLPKRTVKITERARWEHIAFHE